MNIANSTGVRIMAFKSFYHSTDQENLLGILKSKRLAVGEGKPIAGLDSDRVYLSDLYHRYLPIIFGDVIIQFQMKALLSKNSIEPVVYDESDKENFLEMPFEESSWSSEEIVFDYKDIEKIIFVISDFSDGEIAGVIDRIMETENIVYDWEVLTKIPDHSYQFCLERYYIRLKKYAI